MKKGKYQILTTNHIYRQSSTTTNDIMIINKFIILRSTYSTGNSLLH